MVLRTPPPLLAALMLLAGPPPVRPGGVALTHVTVIDTTGGPARPDMTVLVRDGRIVALRKTAGTPVPAGGEVVDGRGKFLIPGLWDMHVHLSWSRVSALPALVATGVVGVRDMGGRLGELDEWRTEIAAGRLVGPRIVRAGPILNGQSFNPLQLVVGNADETRAIVRTLKHVGVDFLKIHRRVPRESYLALMDEAGKQGLAVVGHVPMTVTPEEASDLGQRTLEHTETLFEGTFAASLKEGELPDAIRRFRGGGADASSPDSSRTRPSSPRRSSPTARSSGSWAGRSKRTRGAGMSRPH